MGGRNEGALTRFNAQGEGGGEYRSGGHNVENIKK